MNDILTDVSKFFRTVEFAWLRFLVQLRAFCRTSNKSLSIISNNTITFVNDIIEFFKPLFQIIDEIFGFIVECIEWLFSGIPETNIEYKAEFVSAKTILSTYNDG